MAIVANQAKSAPSPAPQVLPLVAHLVAIDSVRPDPKNAREHNERNIASIAASLKRWGQQSAIVIDRDGIIRKGTGTWLAAQRLRWPQINAIETKLDAKQAALYSVADNRTGELSYFDDGLLAEHLKDASPDDLLALGFDQAEAHDLLAEADEPIERVIAKAQGNESESMPVVVRLTIEVANVDAVERALAATGAKTREDALVTVCKAYLAET